MHFGEPGQRIWFDTSGQRDAMPLMLVHGMTASRAAFLSNLEALRQHFFVIETELLGHGDSDAPDEVEPYAPEAAVARMAGLVEHLGLSRVLLCGHSLGGALALRFALDCPDLLHGLVVINSNSAAGPEGWAERSRAGMATMAERARNEGPAFIKNTWLYAGHGKRLPEDARAALVADFEKITGAGFAGSAEGLTAKVNSATRLHELRVPTLLAAGTRDKGVMELLPNFIERLPKDVVRVVYLEGAGHAANLEAPREFEAALLDFARSLS